MRFLFEFNMLNFIEQFSILRVKKSLILFIVFSCWKLQAQVPVQIIDETFVDRSFKTFVNELNNAVQKKDVGLLLPLLADSILESKDGCGHCSKKELINYLFTPNSAEESWKEFRNILQYGFYKVDENEFEAPSYRKFLNEDSSLIVLGEKVNIRETPGRNGKVIMQSTFEKFNCDCYVISMTDKTMVRINNEWWQEVILKNGRRGYVLSDFTSESIQRRMTAKKIKSRWQIISVVQPPGC